MADFRIWGRVKHFGPCDFLVIASAVTAPADIAVLRILSATSLAEAIEGKARLLVELGDEVRARGDRVVDVVEE